MQHLYTIKNDGRIVFTPAPFGDGSWELLIVHMYTDKEIAEGKGAELEMLAELDAIEIRSMSLEDALCEFLVDIVEQVHVAYAMVNDEEIYPLTQIGFASLKEDLNDEQFPFYDLEDSIHSLYFNLCQHSKLTDEEAEELLETLSVQEALARIHELEDVTLESLESRPPLPGSRFKVKVRKQSTGWTAHNEDYTFTVNILNENLISEIESALGEATVGYFWAATDLDLSLSLETIKNLDLDW